MRLLTCLGTIIRLERETGRLTHARLAPVRDLSVDFVIALPPEGLAGPLEGPGGMLLLPGRAPGTIYLTRDGQFLSVGAEPYPGFTRELPGAGETLRVVPDDEIEALRDLLTHAWVNEDTGERVKPGEIAVAEGPVLTVAGRSMALGAAPVRLDAGVVTLALEGGPVRLRAVPDSRIAVAEIVLGPGDVGHLPVVRDVAGFGAAAEARFVLPAPAEMALPPLLGSLADREFLYRSGADGSVPVQGRRQLHSDVIRERDRFVVLRGMLAGLILGRGGISRGVAATGAGAIPREMAPYVQREGSQLFLDQAWLEAAPVLDGAHVVFGDGGTAGDAGMIADLIRLTMMAPHLPPEARLLFPASSGGEDAYRGMLEAFGFGAMPRHHVAEDLCRVETLYWPARCTMAQMPASAFRVARDRVLGRWPAGKAGRTRIYVRSTGARSVANAKLIEAVLAKQRFVTVSLQDLTVPARIALFRQADIVVAPHGAALENILFCPPGARVLELSPDCSYRPLFNDMAGKLGLTHAVLPCPTDDGTFDGQMTVPAGRLGLLASLLLSRQAA